MPPEVLLTILVVLGLVLGAMAVTGVLAWVLVLVFRRRESRRGPSDGTEQSLVVADGLFELDGDAGGVRQSESHALMDDDRQSGPHALMDDNRQQPQ